jgi:xylulokinase
VILAVDLGTSVTKVTLWGSTGPLARGRAVLRTSYGAGGRVEQDAEDWWSSIVDACEAARAAEGDAVLFDGVDAVGFSAARQTFVPVSADGRPIGPAMLWSDRRAVAEAAVIADSLGGAEAVHQKTGQVLDGAAVAAKVAWLERREPERLQRARWLLAPRDLTVWRMTGIVVSDHTLASATGLYDVTGTLVPALAGSAADLLPTPMPATTVVGPLVDDAAAELGLRPGIPVVVGAGDRACEVVGTGAGPQCPMVSWGTTANVSLPVASWPEPVPPGVVVSAGALEGWLLEGGLSAADSLLAWLGNVTAGDVAELVHEAGASAPGARGVVATPWLGGARAPWWRDDVRAAFVGLGFDHTRGDLARAALEAVAFDVARCLEALGSRPGGSGAGTIAASGDLEELGLWVEVLAAVCGHAVRSRRYGQAASAGAALVVAAALGVELELDVIDPVVGERRAASELVRRYAELRPLSDRVTAAVAAVGATADPHG